MAISLNAHSQSKAVSSSQRIDRLLVTNHLAQSTSAPNADHVFSFFPSDNADSFPIDYLSLQEYQSLYREVFQTLMAHLKNNSADGVFTYQNVNLLWAFKKKLFNHALEMILRFEILKSLHHRWQPKEIYFTRDIFTAHQPLCEIAAFNSVSIQSCDTREALAEEKSRQKNIHRQNPKKYWPYSVAWGNSKGCRLFVYADYFKARGVMKSAGPDTRSLFFSDVQAPKIFWEAIKSNFSIIQRAYDPESPKSRLNAERILRDFQTLLIQKQPFKGLSVRNFSLERILSDRLSDLFALFLPKLIHDIHSLHQIFQSTPKLQSVFLDEDMAPTKNACAQIAKFYGRKSFVDSHGALGEKSGFLPLTAAAIFVWGNAQKQKMIDWGCSESQVIVSGCARYHNYQILDKAPVKVKVFKDLGLNPNQKMVALAFPPITRKRFRFFEQLWKNIFIECLSALKHFPHIQFILKIKPGSNDLMREYAETWIRKNKLTHVKIIEKYDPLSLVKASDFIITYGSTFAVEGLALNTEVILLHDHYSPLLVEFKKYNVFCYANSAEEIRTWINTLEKQQYATPQTARDLALRECLNLDGAPAPVVVAKYLRGELSL